MTKVKKTEILFLAFIHLACGLGLMYAALLFQHIAHVILLFDVLRFAAMIAFGFVIFGAVRKAFKSNHLHSKITWWTVSTTTALMFGYCLYVNVTGHLLFMLN